MKELREKREEFEKMKIKAQRETVFQDQRIIREHEVNYGKVFKNHIKPNHRSTMPKY